MEVILVLAWLRLELQAFVRSGWKVFGQHEGGQPPVGVLVRPRRAFHDPAGRVTNVGRQAEPGQQDIDGIIVTVVVQTQVLRLFLGGAIPAINHQLE